MVLTNFECWAHGGNANDTSVGANSINRSGMDLFNPRAVSHISSNGYYGFSHINDAAATVAHEQQHQQQDLHYNNNNNNNNCNNNNNNINSISLNQTTTMENSVNAGYSAVRCKKRFYEDDGNNNNIELGAILNSTTPPVAGAINADDGGVAAKRCRYDDEADMAAQYCNDFFSLPMVTPIGTQSCLMDIEDHHHPQHYHQPELQVYADEAMTIAHSQSTTPHQSSAAAEQLQQQQQQQEQLQQHPHHQQQHNHHQYHHNQHYQGHLHRANRDVSRCMMSHMI